MLHLVQPAHLAEIAESPSVFEDDQVCLEGIIQGDPAAFERFYKIYYPRLFRFIMRLTHQPEAVEELIQETLLVVWEKPEHYNQQSKISTWVFGIAYHKTLKCLSRQSRRSQDLDIDEWQENIADANANPAQHQENLDWLNQALTILSPEQRAVIELTFYHGMAYQEIAEILNCPENTVKTRMFHARKKLQNFASSQES